MKRKFTHEFTWMTVLLTFLSFSVKSQTTLSAGDIMFTGINSDAAGSPTADEILVLFLEPVTTGTVIYFTDFGYIGGSNIFQRNSNNGCVGGNTSGINGSGGVSDGMVKWTATAPVSAGSQLLIRVKVSGGNVSSSIGSISIVVQTQTPNQGLNLSSGGEIVHAFQGTLNGSNQVTSATILSSINYDALWTTSLEVCEYTPSPSKNPNTGFEVFFTTHSDNGYYSGTTTGNKAAIQTAILNTTVNWTQSNTAVTLPYVPGSFSVGSSTPVSASITAQTNVSCNGGSDGSLTATATDGLANFSYVWSNGAATSNASSTTHTTSSLSAGTYTVTITDNNGTTSTASSTITQPATAVAASISTQTNVSCNGGTDGQVTASATGGISPYTYSWNTGATTALETSLGAGTYSVTITDNNGCTAATSATITQPTALNASATIDQNVNCNGGTDGGLTSSATGGTNPYTFSWSNGGTTSTQTGMSAGTYTVTITDNNGCTATSSKTLTSPTAVNAGEIQ